MYFARMQRHLLREVFGVEPLLANWEPETWWDYPVLIVRYHSVVN